MWDGSGAKEWGPAFILCCFGLLRAILHSCGNISVFLDLSQCSWELSGDASSKSRLLSYLMGNMELHCMQCRGIEPHLSARGSLMFFLELQQEPGVHSRGMAGMAIQNSGFFSDVGIPVWLHGTHQELPEGLAGQNGLFLRRGRRPRVSFKLPQWYLDSY